MDYVKSGKEQGATLVAGGEQHGTVRPFSFSLRSSNTPLTIYSFILQDGYFIQPTVFTDVKPGMKIHDEEIFGPVLAVATFTDEADAIAKANATYVLSLWVWKFSRLC